MKGVRFFEPTDIPRVAELLRQSFGHAAEMTPALLQHYSSWMTEVFVRSPLQVEDLRSLVYEDNGSVVGFIGVMPRLVSLEGTEYRATVSSNFVVEPKARGPIGVHLYRAYLDLPRDLAFVDEVMERPRELQERLGAQTSPLQSVRWVLPLRPVERVTSLIGKRLPRAVGVGARPIARTLDAVMRRVPRSPFRFEPPSLTATTMEAAGLAQLIAEFGPRTLLRPVTSDGSTEWLVGRARQMKQHGELRVTALHDENQALAGWHVYYAKPGGQSEVLQLAASRRTAPAVLDHLAHDAWSRGAVSLGGVLFPDFLSPLADRRATFEPTTHWMLFKSKHPALIDAFLRGNLLLSRLDGEWCHHVW